MTPPKFTSEELDYLSGQSIGRLATVDSSGAPQNNPVGFLVDEDTGQVLIGGRALGSTRKFRNVRGNEHVAFVVDDITSVDPWVVRGIEVRGTAEALVDVDPARAVHEPRGHPDHAPLDRHLGHHARRVLDDGPDLVLTALPVRRRACRRPRPVPCRRTRAVRGRPPPGW